MLQRESIPCLELAKDGNSKPSALDFLSEGKIDLVVNIPVGYDEHGRPDGYWIRRRAVELEIPLLTDLWLARRVVRAICRHPIATLKVKSWGEYLAEAGVGRGGAS